MLSKFEAVVKSLRVPRSRRRPEVARPRPKFGLEALTFWIVGANN